MNSQTLLKKVHSKIFT